MTVEELTVRVARDAFGRGLDQAPVNGTYAKWCACVSLWGADSPPALGCLLALVRESWGDDLARVQYASDGEWWLILPVTQRRFALGLHGVFGIDQIEQQAIVAALEAAPQVTT